MRTPNSSAAAYVPADPPDDPTQLQRYLRDELNRIAASVDLLSAGYLQQTTVAPVKPRDGMLRYASGAPGWNPGGGKGLYMFSTVWTLVKALP